MRFHLPPSSFTGYLRRCESCVTPCSRIEAPLAQCAPRLNGESNTGSWRTQTPFSTTASMAQPTEQCVHTVRLISMFLACAFCASALPMMLNGSCDITAPVPTVIPERLRKPLRSIVLGCSAGRAPASRRCGAAAEFTFRVSSMSVSSDLRGAVVVVDVLRSLIAAGCPFLAVAGGMRHLRGVLRRDRRGRGRPAGASREKKLASGKPLGALGHGHAPLVSWLVIKTEGASLDLEESLGEMRDVFVKAVALLLRDCIAQRLRCGRDPAVEEAALLREVAPLRLDEMAHRVAQGSDVILRLTARCIAREAKPGEVPAQRRKRCFGGGTRRIGRGTQRSFIRPLHCVGIRAHGGPYQRLPCIRDSAFIRREPRRCGKPFEQRRIRRGVEKPREQAIEVRPGQLLGRQRLPRVIATAELRHQKAPRSLGARNDCGLR